MQRMYHIQVSQKTSTNPNAKHYMPTDVNQYISSDFIGPFETTNKGNRFILTFVDHFSKFLKLYAVPRANLKFAVDCLMDYSCTFGLFNYYLMDKASSFTSTLFKELCKKFGIKKLFTTPQRPQTNGLAEKLNSNIKKSLAIFARETDQWDEFRNFYALIYNNTIHSSINEKPAYQLGYDPILPNDILNEPKNVEYVSHHDFIKHKARQLQHAHRKINERLEQEAEKRINYQHKKSKYRNFYPGDLAYLNTKDCDRNIATHNEKEI